MKFDIKSAVLGLTLGILMTSSFTLADQEQSVKKLDTVYTNPSKVYFKDKEIPLTDGLIELLNTDKKSSTLYMPMDDILNYMNINTSWDKASNKVVLSMNPNMVKASPGFITNRMTGTELDKQVIELIQKTGNWSYVQPHLSNLSDEALKKVIDIYNSKHTNSAEHKDLKDFLKTSVNDSNLKVNLHFEAKVVNENHVGDQWNYYLECDGKTYYAQNQNAEISLDGSDLDINLVVYEYDEGKSDYGSKQLTIPYDLLEKRDTLKFTFDIPVFENGGPYSGNEATVEYSLSIIPRF